MLALRNVFLPFTSYPGTNTRFFFMHNNEKNFLLSQDFFFFFICSVKQVIVEVTRLSVISEALSSSIFTEVKLQLSD